MVVLTRVSYTNVAVTEPAGGLQHLTHRAGVAAATPDRGQPRARPDAFSSPRRTSQQHAVAGAEGPQNEMGARGSDRTNRNRTACWAQIEPRRARSETQVNF
jgi:hypothetical protein